MPLDGFLVIDKPGGLTSHDVVATVRRALAGQPGGDGTRVGHAGTLDPMATGVLVVCLGAATRLSEWATADDKRYLADVRLGVETDTYDADGTIVAERPIALSGERVESGLAGLRGAIAQVPPAHSAIRIGGRRLYDLARRGQVVDVPARTVTIHELRLLELDGPTARLEVHCSKGTYVRSLAHDLGRRLGCGAHLSALRRTASGPFTLAQAHGLEEAVAALRTGQGPALMLPLETGVADFERVDASAADAGRLRQGLPIEVPAADDGRDEGGAAPAPRLGRAHDQDGRLLAIVERRGDLWWPKKVLLA